MMTPMMKILTMTHSTIHPNRNAFIPVRGMEWQGVSNMPYMSFETKQDWKDYQAKMDDAIWGVYSKDAPEGGYWELVYFTKFLSRFLMMTPEDILRVLDKPHKWHDEYLIYKKFQKLVDGEIDSDTLHTMQIWNFEVFARMVDEPNFKERYMETLEDLW